ncbi:MAG TPA: SIS domain-containing protein [Thermomicrobiales bacterium]|nr:SIS domain-containing protein [Thermomicrobiales bacterium]
MTDPFPTTDSVMYQTMWRQPDDVAALVQGDWADVAAAAELVAGADRIWVTGIGTSYHAALVGGWLLRAAGYDARAIPSFEFATYPEQYPVGRNDAVIVMAHTGVKSYSARAMSRGAELARSVISVGSASAEHPGSQMILRTCIRETSAAYTSSHVCAMVRLAQLATLLGKPSFRGDLMNLPTAISDVLNRSGVIVDAAAVAKDREIYAIGAGPNEPTALELVIKAREAALHHTNAVGAEQFFHGPIVAMDANDYGIAVTQSGPSLQRVTAIAQAMVDVGLPIWTVGDTDPGLGGTHFLTPPIDEVLSPLLNVVPMQMFAYHLAALRGTHPDRFRREDPKYAEAFGLLTL